MSSILTTPGFEMELPSPQGGVQGMAHTIDALMSLQSTCDRIFGNITKAVDECRAKYDDVNGRVTECKERVNGLKGSKHALIVLSSPQFPKNIERSDKMVQLPKKRRTAFKKPRPVCPKALTHAIESVPLGADLKPIRPFEPTERFEFQLLMPPRERSLATDLHLRGLGKLPPNLDSVSSVLLFNTRENLYLEYQDINVFGVARKEREEAQRKRLLGGIQDEFDLKIAADDYIFNPEIENMYNMLDDLPENMPGLGDLAELDWEEYEVHDGDQIAPSTINKLRHERESEMPSVSEMAGVRPAKKLSSKKTLAIESAPPQTSGAKGPPPPMPTGGPSASGGALVPAGKVPPPPPGMKGANAPPMPNMKSAPPPPPLPGQGGPGKVPPPPPMMKGVPPPPPNALPPMQPGQKAPPPPPGQNAGGGGGAIVSSPAAPPPPKLAPPAQSGGGGGMGDVLASIRNFDKTKLKSDAPKTSAAAPPAENKPKTNMSALSQQLANRRRAMEGKWSDEDEDDGKAAKKAASPAPVPPPVAKGPPPPAKAPPPPPNPFAKRAAAKNDDDDW